MPFMWNNSLEGHEDLAGTDTTLQLSYVNAASMAPEPYGVAGKSKCNVGETVNRDNEVSLALELGFSVSSLCHKTNFNVPHAILSSRRDVEGSTDDIFLELDLSVGKRPFKHLDKGMTIVTPDDNNETPKVDLELSLSTVAAESDLTSVTQISSPTVHGKENLALSSIEQFVDEGSTSSKWKRGSLVSLIGSFQDADASAFLDGKGSFVDQAGGLSNLPSVSVQSTKIDDADFDTSQPKQHRRTNFKTCQFPGCQKGARGASGHCISHGGGRRCQKPGCQKGAEGKTAFCKAHGGGRRCEQLGCTKSAEGRTNLCIAHGGGRRCTFSGGCTCAARGKSGLCIRHGGGKRCKMENCTKSAEGLSGLCIAHGGGRRCQYPHCTKGAQGSTKFCKAHGGGKRCTFQGCTKGAEGSTMFCKGHGGGKRCFFQGGCVCTKSVHGGTAYCVSHGGGKRCAAPGCTKSARGRTDFCVRHGGGKRCKFEGCGKSAQGSTDFCKAHGGGKRCLWGQPGSTFGADSTNPCDKFARGKTGLCSAHTAQVQDKRVHGDGTVGLKMKGIDTVSVEAANNVTREGSSTFWNDFSFGIQGHSWEAVPMNADGLAHNHLIGGFKDPSDVASLPEGRVHGGGLMAMLNGRRCF